jgi:hypothetical protein
MPFVKGKSGNPGGKPKELKGIQELARVHAPTAIETLARIARTGKSESARVGAATALLDRGYGRPPQFVSGNADQFRKAIDMSDDELAAIAAGRSQGADVASIDPSQLN